MEATLPKPPSVNHIYGYTSKGGYARSYITKEGRAWFQEAGILLKKQIRKRKPIESHVEVFIELHTAYFRQDVDNILKPILDLLEKNRIIKNDNLVIKLDVEKFKCKKVDQKVVVEIWDYED